MKKLFSVRLFREFNYVGDDNLGVPHVESTFTVVVFFLRLCNLFNFVGDGVLDIPQVVSLLL